MFHFHYCFISEWNIFSMIHSLKKRFPICFLSYDYVEFWTVFEFFTLNMILLMIQDNCILSLQISWDVYSSTYSLSFELPLFFFLLHSLSFPTILFFPRVFLAQFYFSLAYFSSSNHSFPFLSFFLSSNSSSLVWLFSAFFFLLQLRLLCPSLDIFFTLSLLPLPTHLLPFSLTHTFSRLFLVQVHFFFLLYFSLSIYFLEFLRTCWKTDSRPIANVKQRQAWTISGDTDNNYYITKLTNQRFNLLGYCPVT